MRETFEPEIIIEGISYETFYGLLEFLYSGKLSLGSSQVTDVCFLLGLLRAADQFCVDCVKEMCELHLSKLVDVENVEDLLQEAELFQASQLHLHCEWFKRQQHFDVTCMQIAEPAVTAQPTHSSLGVDDAEQPPFRREDILTGDSGAASSSTDALNCAAVSSGFATPSSAPAATLGGTAWNDAAAALSNGVASNGAASASRDAAIGSAIPVYMSPDPWMDGGGDEGASLAAAAAPPQAGYAMAAAFPQEGYLVPVSDPEADSMDIAVELELRDSLSAALPRVE